MINLQHQIWQDSKVQEVMNWQNPDGWLAWSFHGMPGTESGIRLLCEKGVNRDHPVLEAALKAVEVMIDRLDRGIGKVGKVLDDRGLGGSYMIRAALFAQAGIEDKVFVKEQIDIALEGFRAVLGVRTIEDVVATYKDKLIFKPPVKWPSIYHLRLLAFSHQWRTPENQRLVAESVKRLFDLSPIPSIYVRHKSQLMAPASVFMHEFDPNLALMDDREWMMWFHRVELLSRLRITCLVPKLERQVNTLREILDAHSGLFTRQLNHSYFKKWGTYVGLMLEKDWKAPERRIFDLTFRSLLILKTHP